LIAWRVEPFKAATKHMQPMQLEFGIMPTTLSKRQALSDCNAVFATRKQAA